MQKSAHPQHLICQTLTRRSLSRDLIVFLREDTGPRTVSSSEKLKSYISWWLHKTFKLLTWLLLDVIDEVDWLWPSLFSGIITEGLLNWFVLELNGLELKLKKDKSKYLFSKENHFSCFIGKWCTCLLKNLENLEFRKTYPNEDIFDVV